MSETSQLPISYSAQMVISIVGPTATGKTRYAFNLAEKLILEQKVPLVVLISADSRQVYQGLEIVSGADIPASFNAVSYESDWELEPSQYFVTKIGDAEIQLHGVSCVDSDEDWSLAHFQRFAHKLIAQTWEFGGIPIIVGGTGLYHARLFSAELQDLAGPNQNLRNELSSKTLSELQELLKQKSSDKFEQMTLSDQHNKRRLVRAFEQLEGSVAQSDTKQYQVVKPKQHQIIGLIDDIAVLEQKILQRVKERITAGAVQEVEALVSGFSDQKDLAIFSATGVKEIVSYLSEKIGKEALVELWFRRERQYAKRQITWWKKYNQGVWLNAQTLLAIPQTN